MHLTICVKPEQNSYKEGYRLCIWIIKYKSIKDIINKIVVTIWWICIFASPIEVLTELFAYSLVNAELL